MATEKDLIEAFRALVQKNFPNPRRIGCPGHDALVQLASGSESSEFTTILRHIRQCAPCFGELSELRRRQGNVT